jgi:diguanylate cyclase (GGDEF)-like protein
MGPVSGWSGEAYGRERGAAAARLRTLGREWGIAAWLLVVVATAGASAWHAAAADSPVSLAGVLLAAVAVGVVRLPRLWLVAALAALWVLVGVAGRLGAGGSSAYVVTAMAAATAMSAVVHAVRRRDRRDLAAARRALEATTVEDRLTGLLNRRGLALLAAPILDGVRRRGDALHCHVVEVDGFHEVSGVLGVTAANDVVVALAEALKASTRGTDVVARWTPQVFVVVGPGPGMRPAELDRRVRCQLALHPPVDPRTWVPRLVVGTAVLAPWDEGSLDSVLDEATEAVRRRRAVRESGAPATPGADAGRW